jgi:DNA-damage-inducible protein J
MAKTVLNVKTDKEVKEKAQKLAKELGLPLSTVVNGYLKDFIREQSITFSTELQLRPEAKKRIDKAREDFRKGRNISGPFYNAEDMIRHLNS